jgi:hypothetical protein
MQPLRRAAGRWKARSRHSAGQEVDGRAGVRCPALALPDRALDESIENARASSVVQLGQELADHVSQLIRVERLERALGRGVRLLHVLSSTRHGNATVLARGFFAWREDVLTAAGGQRGASCGREKSSAVSASSWSP